MTPKWIHEGPGKRPVVIARSLGGVHRDNVATVQAANLKKGLEQFLLEHGERLGLSNALITGNVLTVDAADGTTHRYVAFDPPALYTGGGDR